MSPKWRFSTLAIALLVLAGTLSACTGGGSTSGPTTLPPNAVLGSFIPPTAVVSSEKAIQLAPSGPPQEVVTYVSQQPNSQGFTYRDLLVLSWDHFAKRWVSVFDGATAPAIGAGTSAQQSSVLPTNANISRLDYFPITPTKNRTDLVLWSFLSFGANGDLQVGIIHYDGQTASVDYFQNYTPAQQDAPSVVGTAPNQQLSIPAGWLTSIDPECCAIRDYVNTIGLQAQTQPGGYKTSSYIVTSSTQSWLGAYVGIPQNQSGGATKPNPVVMTVVSGGPAAGVLQPGDQLLSVSGETVPSSSDLGPPVIDEIAKNLPNTTIPLVILRGGSQQVVNIKLSSRSGPSFTSASAPALGYLGVGLETLTPQLQQEYNFVPSTGAVVTQVQANSSASNAGLAYGDVITSYGSTPVSSAEGLANSILLTPPGTSVQVAYSDTTGTPRAVNVTLGSYPTGTPGPQVVGV